MYTHFYGFSEEPFGDSPDPKFLFLLPGHQQVLNCLVQGLEAKKGWLLLLGDAGSGKTLFIHQMLNLLKQKPKVKAAPIFRPHILLEDFLKEVLSALDLPSVPPNGVSGAEHFRQCLKRELPPETELVLFIDEAQGFPVGVLGEIYKFFHGEEKGLPAVQVVLAGQPALEEKLESQELRALAHAIQVRCRIAPLTEKESRRYIDHRLHLVGGKPEVFAPEALALILRSANGVPRTINLVCDNSLRIGQQISEPVVSAATVRKALQGMYLENDRFSRPFEKKRLPALRARVFYPVAAVGVLILVIFIALKFPGLNPLGRSAPSDNSPARGEIEATAPPPAVPASPLPQEGPAASPAPAPPVGEARVQTAPDVSAPSISPKSEFAIKKVIVVKKGDTLNTLCLENYGRFDLTLLDWLMQLNPEITDPNLILTRQKIKLPDATERSLLVPASGQTLRVYLGTFRDRDEVRVFRENPALKGKEIKIIGRRVMREGTWYRAEAGDFSSEEEALKTIRALKNERLLPLLTQ